MEKGLRLVARSAKQLAKQMFDSVVLPLDYRRKLPYPITVTHRDLDSEKLPEGGGTETFDQQEASKINQARLAHLDALQLPVDGKTVLDVGCGVGHLAYFFVNKGCDITCLDGRSENIDRLHQLYPELKAYVADVEAGNLERFGTFDIVFSYGLLYHLENPSLGLRHMASVCREVLLLETMVSDSRLSVLRLDDETSTYSQALRGLGCRPSPSYIVQALNRIGFKYVYAPQTTPDYQDFKFTWKNNLDIRRNGHPLRCIFVASRFRLQTPQLVNLLGL